MRVHITGLQGIGVMAIFQCRLLHSALMMVSTQASLLNNLIRSLKQLILRKIASFNVGTSQKKKKSLIGNLENVHYEWVEEKLSIF